MSTVEAGKAAHERAGALINERRFREAAEPAAEACRLSPAWCEAWWNYAVALKHEHRWAECLDACDRAIALDPNNSDGVHWNAGIAATALGNWARARAAWSDYGIKLPDGEGPLEMDLGTAAVRLCPEDEPEVVFGVRLDPCRMRIISVPLPDSEHRYGDIVLHDGEPRGKRRSGEREITVFDELLLLQSSPYGTWTVQASCRGPEERDALLALFDDVDGAIEDWTENLEVLCAACSLGTPHEHHAAVHRAWKADRRLGLALRDERDLKKLRQLGMWWRRGVVDVTRAL